MRRIAAAVFVLSWPLVFALQAQQQQASPQAPPSLVSESHVVLISVAVRDATGQNVQGLSKQDFSVFDNGKPRDFLL
ncbi:MAG TPA: hypothetical protein VIY69_07235, partial [Candidatus Acidoferrales bacterium]